MRLIDALCTSIDHKQGCGNVTEHTLSGSQMRCVDCGYERRVPNEVILAKLRDNAGKEQNLRGALLMLQEENIDLHRMLVYVPAEAPKDPWKRYETAMPCTKCGRQTRWGYNGAARCHPDGCRPVAPKPRHAKEHLSNAEMRNILNDMFNDDDPADDGATLEIIKREAR